MLSTPSSFKPYAEGSPPLKMAAAAGFHRATVARRRVSIWYETSPPPLSPKRCVLSPIPEACSSTSYVKSMLGYCSKSSESEISDTCSSTWLKSMIGYCSATSELDKSISNPVSSCYRLQTYSHPNAALKIMRRDLSSSSEYWRAGYDSEPRIPRSQGIIDPSPQLVKAPIWQISFVSPFDCAREAWMGIDEFCYMNPIWRLLDSSLVSSAENIHVMDSPWRRFIRVMGVIGSYNNSHEITTYPSFFKENIKVSRRFLEPALIDPVGVRFDDPAFQSILQQKQANGPAITFHAIRRFILDIINEFFPNVITPLDVDNVLKLMNLDLISEQIETLIVNNPCLLPDSGRVHFTHFAHYWFLTELASVRWPHPKSLMRTDVLSAIGSLATSDGTGTLEEVIASHPLMRKIFTHRGSGILTAHDMRKAATMKGFLPAGIPEDKSEVILRGALFLGLQWNMIKHSLDPEVLRDPKIIELGDYTIDDVIDLLHGKIPLGLPRIGDMVVPYDYVPYLELHNYFPAHADAFKANRA